MQNLPHTGSSDNWFSAITPAVPGSEVSTSKDDLVYLLGTAGSPPLQETRQILGRVSVASLLDMSLDGMEVWGTAVPDATTPAVGKEEDATLPQKEQEGGVSETTSRAGAGGKDEEWAPLDRYHQGDLEAIALVSPVYTGVSLHYHQHLKMWYSVAIDWMAKRAILQTASEVCICVCMALYVCVAKPL